MGCPELTIYDYFRLVKETLPDGRSKDYEYYPTGELKSETGTETYPVSFGYDEMGNKTSMMLYRVYPGTPDTTSHIAIIIYSFSSLNYFQTGIGRLLMIKFFKKHIFFFSLFFIHISFCFLIWLLILSQAVPKTIESENFIFKLLTTIIYLPIALPVFTICQLLNYNFGDIFIILTAIINSALFSLIVLFIFKKIRGTKIQSPINQ